MIIDANTGSAYNIDDVDISQFTEMYIVSPHDDPFQEYEKVSIQLLKVDDIKKEDDGSVLQEIAIQQKIDVNSPEIKGKNEMEATDEKRDVRTPKIGDETGECVVDQEKSDVNAAVSNEEKGDVIEEERDVTGTETTDEKCDVRTPKIGDETEEKKATENVTRTEVVSESAESEGQESEKSGINKAGGKESSPKKKKANKYKKGSNSDSYDSSTEDTTTDATDKDEKEKPVVSSKIELKCFYKKDAKRGVTNSSSDKIIEIKDAKRDVTSSSDEIVFIKHDVNKGVVSIIELSTEEENVVEKRSPDLCNVKFSQTKCRIKDTVPEQRRRTRSEYQCTLARQFKNTSYHHPKNVNVGPTWDYFEDVDALTEKSDTSNTIADTSDTMDMDRDSHHDNSKDESVMYVLISFYMSHLLLSRFQYYITFFFTSRFCK